MIPISIEHHTCKGSTPFLLLKESFLGNRALSACKPTISGMQADNGRHASRRWAACKSTMGGMQADDRAVGSFAGSSIGKSPLHW